MPQYNPGRHTSLSPASVRRRRQTANNGDTQKPPTERRTIDTLERSAKASPRNSDAIYLPSFTVAFRLLACVRVMAGALLSLSNSRETLTAWEPLHYLQFGYGIQSTTGSFTDQPASLWIATALQALLARVVFLLSLSQHKPQLYFVMQLLLGVLSATCEARFYRAVAEHVHPRIGRYTLVAMLGSAGLARAAISLEPNRLAMCLLMVASPYLFRKPSMRSGKRVYYGLFWVSLATMLGWSVASVVALPLIVEELFWQGTTYSVSVGSEEPAGVKRWRLTRCIRIGVALGFVAAAAFLILVWAAAISLYTLGIVTSILHSRGHALAQVLLYGRYLCLGLYILLGISHVIGQCYFFHGPLTLFQGFAHRVVQPSHNITLGLALSSPLTHPLLCLYPSTYLFASHYFVPEPYRVRFIDSTRDTPTSGVSKSYSYYPSSPTVTNVTKEVPFVTWPALIARASQNAVGTDQIYSSPDDHSLQVSSAHGTTFKPCHYLLALQKEVKNVDESDMATSLPQTPWAQSELTWKPLGCHSYLDTQRTWWPLQQLYLPAWLRRGLQRAIDLWLGNAFPWDMTLYWDDVCLFARQ
ncbi:mannosyltransferase [Dispira simplex]|nr:mannosyltransferase [Dispira simplex]